MGIGYRAAQWSTAAVKAAMARLSRVDVSKQIQRRLLESRAIEAAIWGMPLVNFDAMRQAYRRDAGAQYNDIIYWSKPADWKVQITTPNNSTNYVLVFLSLKSGALVVEVPAAEEAALFGSIIDAWNLPLIDVGGNGEDQGKGGKYLLLPPGNGVQAQPGYTPVHSSTYNLYAALRVIPKSGSDEDMTKALSYLRKLKIYPLSVAASPPPSRFIDVADTLFEGIPSYDESFYLSLARMIAEEPTKDRDISIVSQFRSLGLGKGLSFKPDAAMNAVLADAIEEARVFMAEGFRNAGFPWWPSRKWRSPADDETMKSGATFVHRDRVLLDERAFTFFAACAAAHKPMPNLYVKAFEDAKGETLNGAHTYRLRVPPNVPTTQFWSVVAYDEENAGFIREAKVVGLDSYKTLKTNSDGSVDIYFAPKAPAGQETNWISTAAGRNFFVFFRNYAPEPGVLNRTSVWILGDIEKVA